MNTPHRASCRAFALPLVILLTLVISLGLGLILSRSGASNAAVNQQIKVYQQHHRHAGLKEMVDRWLATTHGSMRDQLDSDGQAFVLELPRNVRVRVTITDGQGSVLDDLRGLYGPEARYTAVALEAIRRLGDPDRPELVERLLRKAGPAAVSVNSAPSEVIEAVTTAVVPGREGERLAAEYLSRRNAEILEAAAIRAIAIEMGVPNEEAAALELMLTALPTVWKVDAIMTVSGRVVERSGGLIEIITDPGNGGTVGVGARTRFLTWSDLPLD